MDGSWVVITAERKKGSRKGANASGGLRIPTSLQLTEERAAALPVLSRRRAESKEGN